MTIGVWAFAIDVPTPTHTSAPFSAIRMEGIVALRSKFLTNSRLLAPGPEKTVASDEAALACIVDVPSSPI